MFNVTVVFSSPRFVSIVREKVSLFCCISIKNAHSKPRANYKRKVKWKKKLFPKKRKVVAEEKKDTLSVYLYVFCEHLKYAKFSRFSPFFTIFHSFHFTSNQNVQPFFNFSQQICIEVLWVYKLFFFISSFQLEPEQQQQRKFMFNFIEQFFIAFYLFLSALAKGNVTVNGYFDNDSSQQIKRNNFHTRATLENGCMISPSHSFIIYLPYFIALLSTIVRYLIIFLIFVCSKFINMQNAKAFYLF